MKNLEGILLACDMDGTLLDAERRISVENLKAIHRFTAQGGLFSLATGRAPAAVVPYLDQLQLNAPYSLLNGSLIRNKQHETLSCAGMPEETKTLIKDALSNFSQIGCEIFAGETILVRQMGAVTAQHLRVLHLDYTLVTQDELGDTSGWCKINLTGEPQILAQLRTFLKPYEDRFSMASSLATFCEITPRGIDKGAALRQIASCCGIAEENTFAIGDSFNDEMMLRAAHTSFAPANADSEILKIADVVVADHNENAVAQAIEWIEQRYLGK